MIVPKFKLKTMNQSINFKELVKCWKNISLKEKLDLDIVYIPNNRYIIIILKISILKS